MDVRLNITVPTPALRTYDKPQAAVGPQVTPEAARPVPDTLRDIQAKEPGHPSSTLDQSLREINKSMQALSQELEFSIDPDTDRTIVKVIDQRTQEVIRQMPSAEALEIAKALDRLQGLLIRQQA